MSMKPRYQIRWLIRMDMPAVLAIEYASFDFFWDEEDFLTCLRERNCIGMVVESRQHEILGFMIYELHKARLRLLNFAVHPDHRREGVGTEMVSRLKDKLSQQRRRVIFGNIRETNLDAQHFFQAQGFRAIEVLRGEYEDTDEDAYVFEYRIPEEAPVHA